MNRKGFTLVEIMIVVAIIALLAAIAIPNLLSAKKIANEAAAKANIRALSTAAEVYATGNNGNYPTTTELVTPYAAAAPAVCGNTVQGYTYVCGWTSTSAYTLSATPVAGAGVKTFTVTQGGNIVES